MAITERPPYINFERRGVDRRDAEGKVTMRDVDFALITPVGSRDVVEKPVTQWLEQAKWQAKSGRIPPDWVKHYQSLYDAWLEGQEAPVNGTSVRNWPAILKHELRRLETAGIKTVEDLAAANEEVIAAIGMGGRSLKQRAEDWVKAQASGMAPLVAQLDSQKQVIEKLEERLLKLEQENSALRQVMPSAPPSVEASAKPKKSVDERVDEVLG